MRCMGKGLRCFKLGVGGMDEKGTEDQEAGAGGSRVWGERSVPLPGS